jgi:DNA-binding MarR family transcriptional regulator
MVDEILRTRGRIVARTAETGAAAGLTGSQMTVLSSIVSAATPPTVPRIARSLGFSRQAVQQVVDVLVERGLVTTTDNPDHKTARLLVGTSDGHQAQERADALSQEWAEHVAAGFGAGELELAVDLLRRFRQRVESA